MFKDPPLVHEDPSYSSVFVMAFGEGSINPPQINPAVPVPEPAAFPYILVVFKFGPDEKLDPS